MANTYHIGLIKGSQGVWTNGHRPSTVVVQMRRCIDYLSPDLWKYMGQRITTKASVKTKKNELLMVINSQYQTDFQYIVID